MYDIKSKIDEYLEFDSDLLFKGGDLVRIFGGAIRDIIAEQKINDIDILCGSHSYNPLAFALERNGYVYIDSVLPKDLASIYSDIHVICEPRTWIKGNKIVQIIRPSGSVLSPDLPGAKISSAIYKMGFNELLKNVDLSCCGLSFDGRFLYEDYNNAILHAKSKVFSVNKNAYMYSHKRIDHRRYKLIDRGWKQIENTIENNRDLKIDLLV